MVEEIEPAELTSRQQAGELWQLLDVRELWEIETARISGTINIPMARVPERLGELNSDLQTAVLCHSGGRSRRVAEYLEACGFRHVANVSGGIDLWSQTVDPSIARY
jgi:rhodanese-related sulfurtransferase